jgi:uncharacterized protein (AIM24 family)
MNCKIVGYEYKTLEVTLSPGESFYAERGSIVYVDEALQRDVEFNGSGSSNSGLGSLLGGVLKSALSGESILIIRFYNPTNTERKMVLSGSCCALVPIRLQGENLICRRGHYVASTNKINLNLNISLQGLVGGVGSSEGVPSVKRKMIGFQSPFFSKVVFTNDLSISSIKKLRAAPKDVPPPIGNVGG